jgi:hypothetical protein
MLLYPHHLILVSFAVIATAMSIILLNEELGMIMIDTVVPGFFSSILLVGSSIYRASPVAFIIVVVSIGALVYYLCYVFHPAQNIVARQSLKLKRMQVT